MFSHSNAKKRCIIIPAFNEAENIASVITGVKSTTDTDIIVIDDGSQDHTAEKAGAAGAFVIRHPFNMGYGVALQTGYKYAVRKKYDVLLQMDGDGQHQPGAIDDFFTRVESGECDVLVGSRFLGIGGFSVGYLKLFGIRLFRIVIRIISGEKITDPTSGFQCLNRDVFTLFIKDNFPCDYPDANIIIMLFRKGFVIRELPVIMVQNPEGRSMHQGLFTKIYYLFKILFSIFIVLIREK
ncbi:glycosyltransferase family 2 protein [Thermodesulfobacteriota bacterium]